MQLTAVQTLAAWIVFAQRSGKDGPIFPPRDVMENIVKHRADRYEEAEAMATHFLSKVKAATPETFEDTAIAGARFIQGLDKKLGGFFGTAPVKALRGNGK